MSEAIGKEATELAARLYAKTGSTETSESSKSEPGDKTGWERFFAKFWAAALLEFSTKWTASFGDADGPTYRYWSKELRGYNAAEMRDGFNAAKIYSRDHEGWPPQLAQFRAMCRPAPINIGQDIDWSKRLEHQSHKYILQYRWPDMSDAECEAVGCHPMPGRG